MPRFKRGQKVVCVDVQRYPLDGKRHDRIKLGAVYEIRDPDAAWPAHVPTILYRGPPYVKLIGIYKGDKNDTPFGEFRFEPLEPKHQSIEEFRKLLTPRVREDA
jgi:hypothetical protein